MAIITQFENEQKISDIFSKALSFFDFLPFLLHRRYKKTKPFFIASL